MTILASRWIASFIGTALLAVLVWFFTPLLSGFEEQWPRLIVLLALLLAWGGSNLFLDIQQRRRDAALTHGIAARSVEETEEFQALQQRLASALDHLKSSLHSRGYLYEQPWYAIIGPPGAGKTTALLNAGLRFPLADKLGQGSVAGVGGTRLCDWWFTEDAVLIDTAGRYTTQDSDAVVDRAGWNGFLDLLKQTRPRAPLNGLLVAFPLSDLAMSTAAQRKAHAATIRSRIKELQDRFSLRMPVYVLFTKADLIVGFTEFFDDLDHDGRSQVWGTTFDLVHDTEGPVAAFPGELRILFEQLNARLLDRVQAVVGAYHLPRLFERRGRERVVTLRFVERTELGQQLDQGRRPWTLDRLRGLDLREDALRIIGRPLSLGETNARHGAESDDAAQCRKPVRCYARAHWSLGLGIRCAQPRIVQPARSST